MWYLSIPIILINLSYPNFADLIIVSVQIPSEDDGGKSGGSGPKETVV